LKEMNNVSLFEADMLSQDDVLRKGRKCK
jgi:hypothetical protein